MTHKEKLKEAKKLYESANADQRCILERLFPELKESEDETIRKSLIEMVHDTTGDELWVDYGIHKEETLAWLEKQGEQKTAEWSEDDIEMIDRLIRHCEKEHDELCNDRYGHQEIVSDLKMSCRKRLAWLESLRNKVVPQNTWKPSEEQIKAVRLARSFVVDDFDENPTLSEILVELEKQLKKL